MSLYRCNTERPWSFFFIGGVILLCLCLFFPLPDIRAEEKPITITSQRMTAKNKEHLIIFEKDVVAEKDGMTIYSNTMEVLLKGENKEVSIITALGDVKIVSGNRIATAQKAVYYKDEEKVVLTGDPEVREGKDAVSGNIITLFLKEDKSIVEGGKVVLYPGESSK